MDWLKTIVPLLGTALGGPLGGAAAAMIADKLGIPDKTVQAVSEVLNSGRMSADQIASLKLAEIDFQKFLKEQNIKLEEISASDRDSARKREIAVKDKMPAVLAILILIAATYVSYMVFYGGSTAFKDPATAATAGTIVGYIFSELKAAFAYYFGTTASGQTKDATISEIAKSP